MKTSAWFALLLGCAGFSPAATQTRPASSAELGLETGVLWQVGENTPLPYRLVPTQLSWRSAEVFSHGFQDGSRVLVRHRLTLIGTWVQSGPESRYVGFSGSPSIEWWDKNGRWSVFGGAGGGFGWIDSRGVLGSQGQDFTLNWFARGGLEFLLAGGAHVSTGLMFQHLSNGGQTDPNPGIDALGMTIGYSWKF